MKTKNSTTFVPLLTLAVLCAFTALPGRGAFLYVDANSTNPIPPYTNWATAAITIQAAVDAASAGDEVWVWSGVYSNGFGANAPVPGNSNRVTIAKAITVQAYYGPETTIIEGAGPLGLNGVRCVYLTNGAALRGFTLRGGTSVSFSGAVGGGGAFVTGGGRVEDCIITNCEATFGGGVFVSGDGLVIGSTVISNRGGDGGGLYLYGTNASARECFIANNANAQHGGGVYVRQAGWLDTCTIQGNLTDSRGGGVYLSGGGAMTNCLVQGNRCGHSGGGVQCYQGGLVDRCRLFDNVAEGIGAGYGGGLALYQGGWGRNCLILGNCAFYCGGGVVLSYTGVLENCTVCNNHTRSIASYAGGGGVWCQYLGDKLIRNCIIRNNASVAGPQNWGLDAGPALFEYCCTTPTNGLPGGLGCFDADPLFMDPAAGIYGLQLTSPCRDAGINQAWMTDAFDLPGRNRVGNGVVDLGAFEGGIATLHVWTNSPLPTPPYESWATAAHTIQDAVDAAINFDLVLVTNGFYTSGGAVAEGSLLTNRVMVDKEIRVQSVNGPAHTFIVGQGVGPGGTNDGDGAVRCAYLKKRSGASLCGFTLTNGHTRFFLERPADEALAHDRYGGGAWGPGFLHTRGFISNCVVTGNSAYYGGGVALALPLRSMVTGNTAYYGGGVCDSLLDDCIVSGNYAISNGGGFWEGYATDTLIVSNIAAAAAGGGFSAHFVGCTVCYNTARTSEGGVDRSTRAHTCIIYYNTAPVSPNYPSDPTTERGLRFCCSYPYDPAYPYPMVTNEPAFVDMATGDFRLRYGSPCIDASTNTWMMPETDLAGLPRLIDGDLDGTATVDLGAYEYNPATYDTDGDGMADGWEHGYGLNPTNATDAAQNPDADPHTNLEEYLADTNPTNDLSYLRIVALSNLPPWTVYFWPSSWRRFYTLESSTNLTTTAWSNVADQVRVPGRSIGTQSLSDTNSGGLRFYRVGASP